LGPKVGTGLGGVTKGISVTGHAIGGQASDQANTVGQAGVGDPGTGQKKGTRTRGQIRSESPEYAGTNPGGSPPRTTAVTLTDP
jgi:hypothetical protein